ncbi:Biopolymer transport protein ExbD/TolR [Candidatus Terasakiella magnetica]|nr:Biopolymer transport protein ExbD/TolR [Candidatus Terasakiella magnetica]
MAMNIGPGSNSDEPEILIDINTTPLIDVMLVLLIMLIITIPMQTHAVKLDLPNGPPPVTTVLPEVVRIDVDFDGTILWNGAVVADRSSLEARLAMIARAEPQPEVHLRPNKLVTYKHVAAVMASAQHLGVTKVGIIGGEQFGE